MGRFRDVYSNVRKEDAMRIPKITFVSSGNKLIYLNKLRFGRTLCRKINIDFRTVWVALSVIVVIAKQPTTTERRHDHDRQVQVSTKEIDLATTCRILF